MSTTTIQRPTMLQENESVASEAELIATTLSHLARVASLCERHPTFEMGEALCGESRDIWRKAWTSWLKKHDGILPSFSEIVPCFEAAKRALESYYISIEDDLKKEMGEHFVRNVSWRLEMARVLMDTDKSESIRESEINELHDRGPSE